MDPSSASHRGTRGRNGHRDGGAVSLLLMGAAGWRAARRRRRRDGGGHGRLRYAAIAAAAGSAAGAALVRHEREIKIVAAVVLAAIALHGLAAVGREPGRASRRGARPGLRALPRHHRGEPADDRLVRGGRRRAFARQGRRDSRSRSGSAPPRPAGISCSRWSPATRAAGWRPDTPWAGVRWAGRSLLAIAAHLALGAH